MSHTVAAATGLSVITLRALSMTRVLIIGFVAFALLVWVPVAFIVCFIQALVATIKREWREELADGNERR